MSEADDGDGSPDGDSPRGATARVGDASFRAPRFASDSGGASGDVEADAAGVLFGRLQDLQQEVMMLRGLVESQQQTIQRLERKQRERYLDLDRRLARITGTEPSGDSGPEDPERSAGQAGEAESGDERSAYERAFALTRDRRFDEAIPAFRELIERYPDGQYVPNAWYWLGELHLALPESELEEARQAFVQVERRFPDHRKASDALYKLGVVHDRLGETERARSYLNRVLDEHPDSSAARLAKNLLEQLGN
ncbi:MAG: tol-pal system protein YbgF [Gammaproteobacteria bacterium]|nr:tol-pal system protein YbgF [Gammaproteobacteria bacterium]